MSVSIPTLDYGTVVGRFLVELADSADDDLRPDVYPAQGYVVFTPGTPFAAVSDATPDPAIVFPQKVIGVLDSQGYLCTASFNAANNTYAKTINGDYVPTRKGVSLQATNDTSLNPHDWTWRVDFYFRYNGIQIPFSGFNFTLDMNTTVDLTLVKPIEAVPGQYTIMGPQGPRGEIGETGPANTLVIGSVETKPTGSTATASITGTAPHQTLNLAIPVGPVGPSGGPMPAGGGEDQTPFKSSGGGFEWRYPVGAGSTDNLIPNGSLEYENSVGWNSSVFTYTTVNPPAGFKGSVWSTVSRTTSVKNHFNGNFAVEPDGQYVFETWIKANKPDSKIYIELRNGADGGHGASWASLEGGAATGAYPVGAYTVPTEWTLIRSRGRINTGVNYAYIASFYINHSAGTENTADVGFAGMRLYKLNSEKSFTTSVMPHIKNNLPDATTTSSGLMPPTDKAKLNNATSNAVGYSLAQRTSAGDITFNKIVLTGEPTASGHAIQKKYVDTDQFRFTVTENLPDLNAYTTPGNYYIPHEHTNGPSLLGARLGGTLNVVHVNPDSLTNRVFQSLNVMVTENTNSALTNSGMIFVGLTATRYINLSTNNRSPWIFQGTTPESTSGITPVSGATFHIPVTWRIVNGLMRMRGSISPPSSTSNNLDFADIHSAFTPAYSVQTPATSDQIDAYGKVTLRVGVPNIRLERSKAVATWWTFDVMYDLAN